VLIWENALWYKQYICMRTFVFHLHWYLASKYWIPLLCEMTFFCPSTRLLRSVIYLIVVWEGTRISADFALQLMLACTYFSTAVTNNDTEYAWLWMSWTLLLGICLCMNRKQQRTFCSSWTIPTGILNSGTPVVTILRNELQVMPTFRHEK